MDEIELEKFLNQPGADHRSHLNRLKRIQGQLQNVINMVEDGKYCINIIHRSKSIRGALQSFEVSVLERHMRGCVKDAIKSEDPEAINQKIDQITAILKNN